MTKSALTLFACFFILISFGKKSIGEKIHELTPPGTIKVADNLFCDGKELSNRNYMEYLYWLDHIYGRESSKFKSASIYPETWSNFDRYFKELDEQYPKHPAYLEYPVVGITKKQAEDYSKWRSDRVFEYLLVKYKVILRQPNQDSTNFFTIERYFAGEYMGVEPPEDIVWYPQYKLPNRTEWNTVWEFASTYNRSLIKKCKPKKNPGAFIGDTLLAVQSIEYATVFDGMKNAYEWRPEVVKPANCFCCKKNIFMNLRGNVRELSAEEGEAYGGGWVDSVDVINANRRFAFEGPSPYTGFRNVCVWQKHVWKEKEEGE